MRRSCFQQSVQRFDIMRARVEYGDRLASAIRASDRSLFGAREPTYPFASRIPTPAFFYESLSPSEQDGRILRVETSRERNDANLIGYG